MSDVYLNGEFVGNVDSPTTFVKQVIEDRRKGIVTTNLNISHDIRSDEVYIDTSKGRTRRPLIVIKNGNSLLTDDHLKQLAKGEITWSDLVKQGAIEYLDANEEENAFIAYFPKEVTEQHTHLEISPMAMLGLCTSLVPFSNYSPSSRINGGSKNQKQALGFYAANFAVRMDMDVNILHTPQVPIVQTIMHDISGYDKHPSGQNVIIAVLSYEGYNMEDAIVINKGSVDRGFGRSTYFRPSVAEELRYAGGLIDEISIPDKDVKGYKTEKDYRFLEEDGII